MKTARDMQQLHGTGRGSERQPGNLEERKRHAATALDWRESERKPATIEDSERHAATQWDRRASER